MSVIDYDFYKNVYMGQESDEDSFPALAAHALRIIGAMTRFQVTDDNFDNFPAQVQTLYRYASCAQIDFLSINGLDSMNSGSTAGFTVGKVHVEGKSGTSAGGALSAFISPLAVAYLEQTGLMNPQVATMDGWCRIC